MNIQIFPKAKKFLEQCKKKEKKLFLNIVEGIDDLEKNILKSSNIKSLTGVENGFRKRVGRHRILFSIHYEEDVMKIWIIGIEKDTQKDYKKWISFILSRLPQ